MKSQKKTKELRKGYTTGAHASFAFASALDLFLTTKTLSKGITIKMDNDDLDVTKGCEITVSISTKKEEIPLNSILHTPYLINNLELYAGMGVGVVSKAGLRPPKGYPAINPAPLKAISEIYHKMVEEYNDPIYASISVTDGEDIAKETANEKVGVLGGISILGTTGIVKPISNSAYLESVRIELNVIYTNKFEVAVLTLGNSSFSYAKEHYDATQIVEVGNFIYDAMHISQEIGIKKILLVCGIGKAVKVAQGHKNTHNRFGSIDFTALKKLIITKLNIDVDIDKTKTVKGLVEQLKVQGKADAFYALIKEDAQEEIKRWFNHTIDTDVRIL